MSQPDRSARAALDVLLTDAALGNPAEWLVRQPGSALTAAGKVLGRPDRVTRRAASLIRELGVIAAGRATREPHKRDKRFVDPAWRTSWYFRRLMQSYLAVGDTADGLIDDAQLDWQLDRIARFVVANVHDLLAPTNFLWSNPAVLKQTLDDGGLNLVKGVRRAGRDAAARRLPATVDISKFEVGRNLAVTEGAIVMRTDVFELIQYTPRSEIVRAIPVMFVPPTINRYYVLDLARGRSLVEHLVNEGQQVFMVSWRNPTTSEGHFDLDTYAAAVLEASAAAAAITNQTAVHVAAACSGGLISCGALAHLADTGRLSEVASLTLMVCALDNARAGTATALATRELAAVALAESARKGYLESQALANVFAWLRPNDLIWAYVINNYLMGKPLPAFDILYWNQDGVRLAAGLHRDFVHMALDNTMMKDGKLRVLGSPVDLEAIDCDAYLVAGSTDHIVPWENAYRGALRLGGARRFVLSTSGHVQALINPPGPDSRSSYRVTDNMEPDESTFECETPKITGSWWPDYVAWLGHRSGDLVPAPSRLGNDTHKALARAPGTYVHAA